MAMAVAASSGMANAIAIATSTSASSFFLKRSCCMPQQQPRKDEASRDVLCLGTMHDEVDGLRLCGGLHKVEDCMISLTFSLNIRCARVGGIEIPNSKRIEISLQYIHGVGKTTARQILLDAGMENRHTRELTEEDLTRLRDEVSKYMIEGDLRRFNNLAIKRLKDIQCYRGRRHIMSLPCRGQHTKCNARTRKGKKKITVAGKKKAPKG